MMETILWVAGSIFTLLVFGQLNHLFNSTAMSLVAQTDLAQTRTEQAIEQTEPAKKQTELLASIRNRLSS